MVYMTAPTDRPLIGQHLARPVVAIRWARRRDVGHGVPGPAHRTDGPVKYRPRSLCGPVLRGVIQYAEPGAMPADWHTCKQCERDAGEARR